MNKITRRSAKNRAAQRILSVTEEELQQIVLDIHDGPVQYVFAALSQIQLLQKKNERGEPLSLAECNYHLGQTANLLSQTLLEIRNFLGTFRSPDFSCQPLGELLQALILQHETFTDCQVSFSNELDPFPVALPIKIALYRICQEALTNAYRHSGTKEQQVHLIQQGQEAMLIITDQGRGFAPPPLSGPTATEKHEHIGLRGMRDRVELLGGRFELHTAPLTGVRIVVSVPLDTI
ncbi:MAG: hypothetical protein KA314_20315 [Chloroflexi bacterium]|nr:hypothetical protein [Chloroflexota bacterium]MBP8058182.1 hypothetical protein [Chloroflexota bacterium]